MPLSDKLKLAIADALVLFSKVESCATEVVAEVRCALFYCRDRISRSRKKRASADRECAVWEESGRGDDYEDCNSDELDDALA